MLDAVRVRRKHPLGVSVLAVATIAAGLVATLVSVWDVFRGYVFGALGSSRAGELSMLSGIPGLLVGAVVVVAGIGLAALRPWAWWLAVLGSVVAVALSFGAVLWMAVWAALLVYLLLVRSSFGVLGTRPQVVVS